MKRKIIDFLKSRTTAQLPSNEEDSPDLSESQKTLLVALYHLVTADSSISRKEILGFVDSKIALDRRYLAVYQDAENRINQLSEKLSPPDQPVTFLESDKKGRKKVLEAAVGRYPHPENEATWKHYLRLNANSKEQLFSSSRRKQLRNFVVREFLEHFYGSENGWQVVGYDSYPGNPKEELKEVSLDSIEAKGERVFLHLSDETIEKITRKEFDAMNSAGMPTTIEVKSGRQKARLSENLLSQWMRVSAELASRQILNHSDHSSRTEYDCVIVGSGPVGAVTADILVRAGLQVAMLESGAEPDRNRFDVMLRSLDNNVAWNFKPWNYEMRGDDLDMNTFAVRKVGGSSLAWGAVAPRFLESDFKLQSRYGVGKDWPIGYQDLFGDYLAAERFMGVSGHDDNPFLPKREAPYPMPGFEMSDTDKFVKAGCDRIGIQLHSIPTARNTKKYQGRSKCINYTLCRACPVGAIYSSDQTVDNLREFENFHLITNAHVRKVETNGKNIEAVRYHDEDGREHTLRAGRVVLAAQGIENVRILLNSKSAATPDGVANGSGLLGSYLTEHMKFYMMGRVSKKLSPHLRGYETAASQQFQDHPKRGQFAGGRIIVRENAGPTPSDLALRSGLWGEELRDEVKSTFGRFVTLGAFMEQLPYKENRIELSSTKKNAFGDPAPLLHFKLMRAYEQRGYRKMKSILTSIFKEISAKNVRVIMPPSIGGHYMCCHRMGNSIEDSVVDSNCEAHDVQGLHLAGSGSFTTGGVSNPTLTGVALAVRMANHIASTSEVREAATD